MQQIMDDELALCLRDKGGDDDDTSDDNGDSVVYDGDAEDDNEGDLFDLVDTYAPDNTTYVSLQGSSKTLNSLRGSLRRQDTTASRRSPARSELESNKFASCYSAFDEHALLKLLHRGKLETIHGRVHTSRHVLRHWDGRTDWPCAPHCCPAPALSAPQDGAAGTSSSIAP